MDTEIQKQIVTDFMKEVTAGGSNNTDSNNDFESYIGLLGGQRDEKTYEWQSDIRIPEFTSHSLTQSSIDVGQYFQTRDFVEVKIDDSSEEAKLSADAAKECVNRTLNQRDVHHYLKYVRAKAVSNLTGRVWIKCWWEQEFEERQTGTQIEAEELDVDVNGEDLIYEWQEPAVQEYEVPVFEEVAVKDNFQYDIWDQRNVFCDNGYAYSAQDKEWVIFRSEITMSELKALEEQNEYFNLDEIGKAPETTETKQESYEKDKPSIPADSKAETPFDLFERYGKIWVTEDGKPGFDENGVRDDAVYKEGIVTVIKDRSREILIGYKETGFLDANGRPYRPIIRGLCYIDIVSDNGMGDGQNVRELQTAIDDTFNVSQDRTMFSTYPSFKAKKSSIDDNSDLFFEPMGFMKLDDVNDVQEFKINSDTVGALNQLSYLQDKMRQVDNINESTDGSMPSLASTTATAVGAATQNTNTRINYKSLTGEYTFLCDLYWMIQQMTYAFAQEETGMKLMGDKLVNFNPSLEYYYTPLSQSIESEQSKIVKRREWMTAMQTAAQLQHPGAAKMINLCFMEFVKLMGDEYENAANAALNEKIPMGQGNQAPQPGQQPTSNEYGNMQSAPEMAARETQNA